MAALHNDGILILDELGQVDPREAGEAAYLLANGKGKARASRTGTARQSASWRLLFLSAGEESLSALMAKVGKKPTAGQEIRLAEIDIDAGVGMGGFEALNGHDSPASLALALRDAAAKYHGVVGVEWIRHVVTYRQILPGEISKGLKIFVEENAAGEDAQVQRVARRFGLVGLAGEWATRCGLTGWPEGEALEAAAKCFASWRKGFGGGGNREERALLAQVRKFFELHGTSRFQNYKSPDEPCGEERVVNRAGFWREGENSGRQYLVLPEVFSSELCSGFSDTWAKKVLADSGVVLKGPCGHFTQKLRLPGFSSPKRVFVFSQQLWDKEEDDDPQA